MAVKFLDKTGLGYFWGKIKTWCNSTFAAIAHTHTSYAVKHSYTTAANAAKDWYRIANANTSQTDTTKPIHAQFILTAYNASYDTGYYERWFVDCEVFGRNAGIRIFGNTNAPFSQARILYENTIADIDVNDRPAIDIYLNYVLPNGTTKIEIEEVYNQGWTFVADGQISASTIPTGFESVACDSIRSNGVGRSNYSDWAFYTSLQRSDFTANFTLADNNTYRARVLNCTGTITVTVPSLNSVNCWFIIKNFNTTSGIITIHPSTTSVLIDGSNANIVLQPGEYIMIHSKAANAYTIIFDGRNIGINKTNSTEDANNLYSITAGTKVEYYTISNSGTTLTNVPAAVNTTLESRTLRRLSATDWTVEQICHNTNGLYYRRGTNSGWTSWKTFAFTDSNITGNAATASAVAWSGVTGKPSTFTPSSHNQASDTINLLTGYNKPSTGSALATTDTLNQALGKLEAKVDTAIANNDSIPVGSVVWLSTSTVPTGFLLCNGQAVGRTTYPDLFNAIGTIYGEGDGSTTFNLPNLIDKFIEGASTNIGDSVAAGLPNITGSFRNLFSTLTNKMGTAEGVFANNPESSDTTHTTSPFTANTVKNDGINFDASRSSSIYGNSGTVQPPAVKLLPCIKAYSDVDNLGSLDAAQLENYVQNNFVHKTGDESIAGEKTFTDLIYADNNISKIFTVNQQTGLPAENQTFTVKTIESKNESPRGWLEITNYTDGSAITRLGSRNHNEVSCLLLVDCAENDTKIVRPGGNGSTLLGKSDARWGQIYSSSSTISTSDARQKTKPELIPDECLDAWGGVSFCQFKMLESVEKKGKSARFHSGLIAQDIEEAFKEKGLDASVYGLFCYDEWDEKQNEINDDGIVVDEGHSAGDVYSLRYEEALCMEAAYQRRENKRLKAKISDLEKRLEALELLLKSE